MIFNDFLLHLCPDCTHIAKSIYLALGPNKSPLQWLGPPEHLRIAVAQICGTIAAQALKSSMLEEAHHPKHRARSLSVCLPLRHMFWKPLWDLPIFYSSRYSKVRLFLSVQVSAKECMSSLCSVDCKPHLNRIFCFTKSNVCGTRRIYFIIWITVIVSLLQKNRYLFLSQ